MCGRSWKSWHFNMKSDIILKAINFYLFLFLYCNLFSWISTDHVEKILGEILESILAVVSNSFLDVCLSSELCIWESVHACIPRKMMNLTGTYTLSLLLMQPLSLGTNWSIHFMTGGHWVLWTIVGWAPYLPVWPCFL